MKRSLFVAALAGFALVSLPFEARAQVSTLVKPVQFGVAAGAAIPTSDLSDFGNTGFNGTVTVGFSPAMIPLGIRIDGAYNQFAIKDAFGGGNVHFTSVTGNLVYKLPGATVSPYAIGGAGWYNAAINLTGFGGGSDNHFGWNIGGGISLPLSGFDTFIEARYNQVQFDNGSLKFIPITFGVMF
ncbi:MAG: porin family protein [Gemmatimonadota bacterium]|nr:porin family protein [Gemmatimonadota bacterium]